MLHTHTSTSQSRDHVIMSELGNNFAWSTCPRRSTIDSAPIILRRLPSSGNPVLPNPPRFPESRVKFPLSVYSFFFFLFFFFFFFFFVYFIRRLKTHACMYTLHISIRYLSLFFYLPPSTASTISRACNGDLFAAHDVHISCHDDNS